MNNGWPVKPMGEVCENLDSKRIPITKNKRVAGKYPYYGASGVVDHVNDYIFDEDLLLVSEDGANLLARTYPIAFSVVGKVWVNNHAHVLRFPDRASQRFIEFYLNSISLDPYVSGMAQPKLNQKSLNSISIPVPPLPEQRRIVGILDEAFDGIATAKANAEQNFQNARALFESHLNAVFTQRGGGWVEKKLGELYSFKNGINFDKTQKIDRGILTIDVLNMYGDDLHVRLDNLYRVNKDVSGEHILRDGDLLVVRSSVKREGVAWATLFRPTDERVTFCGFIIRGRPVADILPEYAVYFLRCPNTRQELIRRARQSTITNINQFNLGELIVPMPSRSEQTRLVSIFDAIRAEMLRLESIYQRKLSALDELKQSLLHQAFSGQL
jgi:type I restriction enzyme S subunit